MVNPEPSYPANPSLTMRGPALPLSASAYSALILAAVFGLPVTLYLGAGSHTLHSTVATGIRQYWGINMPLQDKMLTLLTGRLHPDVSPVWDIGPLPPKAMYFEPTVHYQLNSTEADAQWTAMAPLNGGIVCVGPNKEPYLVSMFHQLRCLDVLRQAYNELLEETEEAKPVARHCLHYLRQMVLCRRDIRLEPVVDTHGPHTVQPWGVMTCRDWTQVYEAHARNVRDA